MTAALVAILIAAFLSGCVAIHALRRHADGVTSVLAGIAFCLGAFVLLVAAAERQVANASDAADPPACYGFE